jgi:hypothetical protein
MNHSKVTIKFVDYLIHHYAKYDTHDNVYSLSIDNIPEHDVHELSSILLSEDSSYASEATGVDNPSYERYMLPALTRYLLNTTDKDNEIEFLHAWKNGLVNYSRNIIEELLEDRLSEFNGDSSIVTRMKDTNQYAWVG